MEKSLQFGIWFFGSYICIFMDVGKAVKIVCGFLQNCSSKDMKLLLKQKQLHFT